MKNRFKLETMKIYLSFEVVGFISKSGNGWQLFTPWYKPLKSQADQYANPEFDFFGFRFFKLKA